mgnify:CR=1 FL=1
MKGAFGALQWKPKTFWRSTLTEYVTAIAAFNMMHGGEKKPEAPTDDEMAGLLAKYG